MEGNGHISVIDGRTLGLMNRIAVTHGGGNDGARNCPVTHRPRASEQTLPHVNLPWSGKNKVSLVVFGLRRWLFVVPPPTGSLIIVRGCMVMDSGGPGAYTHRLQL